MTSAKALQTMRRNTLDTMLLDLLDAFTAEYGGEAPARFSHLLGEKFKHTPSVLEQLGNQIGRAGHLAEMEIKRKA